MAPSSVASAALFLTNESNPLDGNRDGEVTALDALVIINALASSHSSGYANPVRVALIQGYRRDVDRDGLVSALDALNVINGLRNLPVDSEALFPVKPAKRLGSGGGSSNGHCCRR